MDLIANGLSALLGSGGLGILSNGVNVTYFEHRNQTLLVPHSAYDKNLEVKSIMWEIPFGQTFTIELPPLNFDLGNDNLPLKIKLDSNGQPALKLEWGFKLAFGFDDTGTVEVGGFILLKSLAALLILSSITNLDGFFLYTYPGKESEFFIRGKE